MCGTIVNCTVKNKPVYPKGFTLVRHRIWWCHALVWHSKYVVIFPTFSNTALNLVSLLTRIITIIRSETTVSCSSLLSHLPLSCLLSVLLLDYSPSALQAAVTCLWNAPGITWPSVVSYFPHIFCSSLLIAKWTMLRQNALQYLFAKNPSRSR
jgi:hypothetical protein